MPNYGRGSTTDTDHQPLNFNGDLRSYLIYDGGVDRNYGRVPLDPGGAGHELRGRLDFEHTHYLPDDWEAQVRLGYTSDPTFLEESGSRWSSWKKDRWMNRST